MVVEVDWEFKSLDADGDDNDSACFRKDWIWEDWAESLPNRLNWANWVANSLLAWKAEMVWELGWWEWDSPMKISVEEEEEKVESEAEGDSSLNSREILRVKEGFELRRLTTIKGESKSWLLSLLSLAQKLRTNLTGESFQSLMAVCVWREREREERRTRHTKLHHPTTSIRSS